MDTMQEYVEFRLEQWADWYLRGNDSGIGYPRKNILQRFLEGGGVFVRGSTHQGFVSNSQAEEIEWIVKELAAQNRKLSDALRIQYFESGTMKSKALRLRVSQAQFKIWLGMAKQWVAGRLSYRRSLH